MQHEGPCPPCTHLLEHVERFASGKLYFLAELALFKSEPFSRASSCVNFAFGLGGVHDFF